MLITKTIPATWLNAAVLPVMADLTFSSIAAVGDGYVSTQPYPASWAAVQGDTTGINANYTGLSSIVQTAGYDTTNGYQGISRSFLPFNTSALPTNAVISSSTLNLFIENRIADFDDTYGTMNVYHGLQATSSAIVNSDISKCGETISNPTKGSQDMRVATTSISAYLSFPLNSSGMGWINPGGYTNLCIREGHDATNHAINSSTFTWKYSRIDFTTSESATTTQQPYLGITYTLPNQAPATSTQLRVEGRTNPTNLIAQLPHFSAQYNDLNVTDTAASYQIQVATSSSGFASSIWDSGQQTLATSTAQGTQTYDITYGGSSLALDNTKYYWRIRFWDNSSAQGAWSDGSANFTMADNGSLLQKYHFIYDAVGNITQIQDFSNGSSTKLSVFTYDDINRLITAQASSTAGTSTTQLYNENFNFDPLGNILTKSDTGAYSYTGNTGSSYANPHAVTQIGNGIATSTYAYDNAGNLLSGGGITNTWDYLNRLLSSTIGSSTTSYAYDYQGNRVKQIASTTTYYYPNQYTTRFGTTTEDSIYANGQLLAIYSNKTGSSTLYWNHPDYLGSANVISDNTGNATENLTYYPFGNILTDKRSTAFNQSRKYIGQQYDGSTGLNYLNARYQDPARGQFVSQDPMFLGNPIQQNLQDPQSLNSYSYANDNPIVYKDPSGKFIPLILGGIAAYGFISSAFDAYDTYLTNFQYPNQFTAQERLVSKNKTEFDAATLAIGATDLKAGEQVFLGAAGVVNSYVSDHTPSRSGQITYGYSGQSSYSPNLPQIQISNVNVLPSYLQGTQSNSNSAISGKASIRNNNTNNNASSAGSYYTTTTTTITTRISGNTITTTKTVVTTKTRH